MRDIFGRLCIPPGKLPREQRIDLLLALSGRLLADRQAEARWFGAALRDTLADGGDLMQRLGIAPARGSHATPQRRVRQGQQDAALLRFAAAAGTDARAVRILAGKSPCPPQHQSALDDVIALACPRSAAAIGRARLRVSARHGR